MIILDYIFAARPPLHLPVWSIYLVCLHYHHQLAKKIFGWENLLVMIGLTFLTAAAYYINQVYDYHGDKTNKKLGFLQRGMISKRMLMALFILLSILPIAVAILFSNFIFFIYLQLFVLAFIYSASPLRLKDRPTSGLLANSYAYGFLVPLSVMPEINQHNAGLLGWDNPLIFLLSVMGVFIMTTVPDVEGDKAAGKKTIAVVLPRVVTLLLSLAAFIGAAAIAYESGRLALMVVAIIAMTMNLSAVMSRNNQIVLAAAKVPVLLITLLACYYYPWYLLFVVAMIVATRAYYKHRFNVIYPKLA